MTSRAIMNMLYAHIRALVGHIFTEMASGYVNALPFLSEEDVPGSSCIYATLEKHSVDQLRRWLACRGIERSGNKTALLEM